MVVLLKHKKDITVTNIFQKFLDDPGCCLAKFNGHKSNISEHKPDKIWVDKGCKIYNRSRKSWLQDNGIEIYSIKTERNHNFEERNL